MKILCVVLVFALAMACQTGKIPCPKPNYAKTKKTVIRRNFQQSQHTMSARVTADRVEEKIENRGVRITEEKKVHNVSVEEWDCPRPGAKKYMPRSVRDNIKKNMKKLKQDDSDQKADSVKR